MVDIVVTCPVNLWAAWLAEGDCAGDPYTGEEWAWYGSGKVPPVVPGDRLYVVAHGRLRGFAPITRLAVEKVGFMPASWMICRRGDAQAITIDAPLRGFQSWRYVRWSRDEERPFPDWRTAGVSTARAA